jgi:hypothetical protein
MDWVVSLMGRDCVVGTAVDTSWEMPAAVRAAPAAATGSFNPRTDWGKTRRERIARVPVPEYEENQGHFCICAIVGAAVFDLVHRI